MAFFLSFASFSFTIFSTTLSRMLMPYSLRLSRNSLPFGPKSKKSTRFCINSLFLRLFFCFVRAANAKKGKDVSQIGNLKLQMRKRRQSISER